MSKNILVIEDEHNVAIFIKQGLQDAGYTTLLAYDGNTAFELLNQNTVDLVILDIILPGMDGREIAREIKKNVDSALPILMLTALGTTENIVQGLDSGADDYLVKPFKFSELLARIRALTRRSNIDIKIGGIIIIEDLELDSNTKMVKRGGTEIKLTTTEFRLLEFLMKNKNRVLSRVDILESVWDINFNMATNVVDVYINYLRNKIDKDFDYKLIQTVIGMGYVIRE
nr:response regulator transcription factor [Allomuricauda sp.]